MGASEFMVSRRGSSAREAFAEAVEEAQYECGHGGYTGSIAEKASFTMIPLPEGEDPYDLADKLFSEEDPRIDDKWGPAGCIDCGPVKVGSPTHTYLFFGWASS